VLTLNFVEEMVTEVNGILTQDDPALQIEIEEKQRELADIDKAIGTLLDLAEKFGRRKCRSPTARARREAQ
jgi:hypothetical protein